MIWPFVTRSACQAAQDRIAELKQELLGLRTTHERVLDEINSRATGFHLHGERGQPNTANMLYESILINIGK